MILEIQRVDKAAWHIVGADTLTDTCDFLTSSQYNAAVEVNRVLQNIDFNYHSVFVVFGIRNTRLLTEIYKNASSFSPMIFIEIIEKEKDAIQLEANEDFLKLFNSPAVKFIFGDVDYIIEEFGKMMSDLSIAYNLGNLNLLTAPYVKSGQPDQLKMLNDNLFERFYAAVAGFGNSTEDILVGVDNFVNSWGKYTTNPNVARFEDSLKDVPALIVGAGPSLDENIEGIREFQKKGVIFAVDAAVKTLVANGIVPDAVTTLERTDIPLKFYKDIEMNEKTIFIGPNVIDRRIINSFDKHIFTGRNGDGFFRNFNTYLDRVNLDVGSNVAHVPFAFSLYAGCDPIAFVGVDLAYRGAQTHASQITGEMGEKIKNLYTQNTTKVLGQDGTWLNTYEFFMYTKVWFEKKIFLSKERTFYNSSTGGAHILGAQNTPLSEVNKNLKAREVKSGVLLREYQEKKEKLDSLQLSKKALEYFEEGISFYKEFVAMVEQMKDEIENRRDIKHLETIQLQRRRLEKYLETNKGMMFFLQPIYIAHNRRMHMFPVVQERAETIEMIENQYVYYKTLIEVSNKILESLNLYVDVIKSHM